MRDALGGGSRVTTSTGGKGGERTCECGWNIGGFQMIFAMRIAEELDVDPFNGPSLRVMPASHVSTDGNEAYRLTRLSS